MPSFFPRMPSITAPRSSSMSLLAKGLDLDVHTGGQLELHQGVDGLTRGLKDVEEPFVGTDLELLARLLVDVRRAVHRVARDVRGERDGSHDSRSRPPRRVHDLVGGRVQDAIIERLQADPDLLVDHWLALTPSISSVEAT